MVYHPQDVPILTKDYRIKNRWQYKSQLAYYSCRSAFFLTILLWVCGKQLGVNANTVAMLPIAVFAFTGVVTASDLKDIDWAVIWMVAGGFALGLAMNGAKQQKMQ